MSELSINQLAGVAEQPGAFEIQEQDLANRDTFLKLLTTQLQNQDPTSPMDNEQFLAQLAQFSSLEQLMGLQSSMDAVYTGIQAMNNASMANLLGTEVTARGNSVSFNGSDPVELGWEAPAGVDSATMTITDESGNVVRTIDLGPIDGDGSYTWDGTDADGNPVEEGIYSFSIRATDAEGNEMTVDPRIRGIITGMDYSTGTPQPSLDGRPVSLGDILTLRTADQAE